MMELHGLAKRFAGVPAVADVSLTVRDDEYLTLLGPSGSGKSTLLRLIAGLERPDSGTVLLDGRDITHAPTHLRGLGFVQQKYALFTHMSVVDNVAFGLRNRMVDPVTDEDEVARRVSAMLDLTGLRGLENRMVGQISGGQKQRVSLARTLVTEPRICLLDEPPGALDANLRERMTSELRRIREMLGVTFLHVTGNEAEALGMGDRMIVLDDGEVVQVAPPGEVFDAPDTIRVAWALNAYNILPGRVRDGAFHHSDAALPLPQGLAGADAHHYALRFDAVDVEEERGYLALPFVTSEFMGSRVVHFFRREDGETFEVERHLSRADPATYRGGEVKALAWRAQDALLFDRDGLRIFPAAQPRDELREAQAVDAAVARA